MTYRKDPKTYTYAQLRRMNTDRLTQVHLYLYEAYPASFEREAIFRAVARKVNRPIIIRNSEQRSLVSIVDNLLKQMRAERAGIKQGPQLSSWDITCIRRMHKGGYGYASIGKVYNRQSNYIRNIVLRKIYKWV